MHQQLSQKLISVLIWMQAAPSAGRSCNQSFWDYNRPYHWWETMAVDKNTRTVSHHGKEAKKVPQSGYKNGILAKWSMHRMPSKTAVKALRPLEKKRSNLSHSFKRLLLWAARLTQEGLSPWSSKQACLGHLWPVMLDTYTSSYHETGTSY